MKKITSLQKYAIELEKHGYMALGEPLIFYKPYKGQEKIWLYLNLKAHGTQMLLAEGTLQSNNKLDWFFLEQERNGRFFTFSEFFKEYEKTPINFSQPEDLLHYSVYLGRASKIKCLTYHIAKAILLEDETKTSAPEYVEESIELSKSLLKTQYDFIGRPENLAYLARLNYFSLQEKISLSDLPFEYMVKSFLPSQDYDAITLPKQHLFAEKRELFHLNLIPA